MSAKTRSWERAEQQAQELRDSWESVGDRLPVRLKIRVFSGYEMELLWTGQRRLVGWRHEQTISELRFESGVVVALYFMYYNFARIHETIRCTAAMEAVVSDYVWSIQEIVGLADRPKSK